MGFNNATGMADAVEEGHLTLRDAVVYHLQTNHFPPVPPPFIGVAMEAIELAKEGEYETMQDYPNGLRRQVRETIEGLHLAPFIETINLSVGLTNEEHQEAADARREEIEDR